MDRIKKLGGKFLVLTLSFMMICSIVQIPVKAADTSTDVEYNITITVEGNGTATSDVLKAKKDRLISLTAVPDPGYIFKGWQSDEVIVTPQNNKFYMPAKDVHLKAVFEAVSANRKATVEDVDIIGEVGVRPTKKYFKITLQDDKLKANISFPDLKTNLPTGFGLTLNGHTSGDTETSFTIVTSGKPTVKGKGILDITIPGDMLESGMDLKVMPNPNAKFNIGCADATLDNVTITSEIGDEIYSEKINVNLENVKVTGVGYMADVSSWVTNLPDGLSATFFENNGSQIVIDISGTPTAEKKESIKITIPADKLTSGEALTVTENADAKFNIGKPEATVDDVTVSGAKDVTLSTTTITIQTDASLNVSADADVTSWFTNMPTGLTAKVSAVGSDSVDIQITGTPTVTSTEAMQIKIPASAFGGSEDLAVTSNANAKFDIGERTATVENVEVKGVVGEYLPKTFIKITIQNDKVKLNSIGILSDIKTNLPSNIYSFVDIARSTETSLVVSISGTPQAIGKGTLDLTIPGELLESGKDLKVTSNPNATYNFGNLEVTAGAGSTHKTGVNENMTFTCNGSLDNLTGIYVDGALLDPSNYTVKSGSTILTLKASYLNTLAVGTHTLKFQYKNDMSTDTSFEIVKVEDKKDTPIKDTGKTNTPQTGDTTNIALLMSLLVLSGGAVAFVSKKRKMATKR